MTADDILYFLSQHYGVSIDFLKSKIRNDHNEDRKRLKQLAIYLVYHGAHLTTYETGKIFSRQHTTIVSALQRINDQTYPGIEAEARALMSKIRDHGVKLIIDSSQCLMKVRITYSENQNLFGLYKMSLA